MLIAPVMGLRRSWLLAVVALLQHPRSVLAQAGDTTGAVQSPSPNRWTAHPFALDLQAGWANPFGSLAFGIDVTPLRRLSLNAGAGWDPVGNQVGASARLRFLDLAPSGGLALFAGAGVSAGTYCGKNWVVACRPADGREAVYSLEPAVWLNVATGVEARSAGGWTFRLTPGVGLLLNSASGECRARPGASCARATASLLSTLAPQLAIAVGHAF